MLLARIELATSPLPRECSTTELQQHSVALARFVSSQRAQCNPLNRRDAPFPYVHDVPGHRWKALQSGELPDA